MPSVRQPCCVGHYGQGGIKRFYGPIYHQTGAGFFGDIFRHLIPIVTTKVLPYVGKKLFSAGQEVATDLKSGTSLGKALKKSAKRTLEQGKTDVLRKLSGKGRHKKKARRRDYFSY